MLYSPSCFIEKAADTIREVIAAAPFAMLISVVDDQPLVTHAPVIFDDEAGENWLAAHVARANPHSAALAGGTEMSVAFNDPHAYVSPSWYNEASVPTWNYAVVRRQCRVHVQTGDAVQALLDTLAATFEDTALPSHWSREERAHMLRHIPP